LPTSLKFLPLRPKKWDTFETLVVYHLQGESSWSTVRASGKQNLTNGKFCSRMISMYRFVQFTLIYRESGTSLTIGTGPGTGRKNLMEDNPAWML